MNKGELWLIDLPPKKGSEQKGTRPCIILANTGTNLITVIPLTSNLQALRFPYVLEIKSSEKNKLDNDSIALMFQIQSVDKRRIVKQIGTLEKSDIFEVDKSLRHMLKL
ncbi:MAG: type II toxin-antitoxin system PemK/MazF family toxin [Nanoarchaeota archaeon]